MSEDLIEVVRGQVDAAIREHAAEAEGFRYSVTWQPWITEQGGSVAWFILLTVPSTMLGQLPLAVTIPAIIGPSLPDPLMVKSAVPAAIKVLRDGLLSEKAQAMAAGAAMLGRLN